MQFSKNNLHRNFFVEKYGIPQEILEKFEFYERGKSVWAFSGEFINLSKVETIGVRALRIGKLIKPTTAFLRVIGKYATRNVVYLDVNDTFKFLRGEDVVFQDDSIERGFIIARNEEDILGCGYYTGVKIISEIPKKYRIQNTWL